MALKVFVDTDVVISSLISQKGAAHLLLNKTSGLDLIVTNISFEEQKTVAKRLNLQITDLTKLKTRLKLTALNEAEDFYKKQYTDYVLDPNDAHVVAGAKESKVRFLITYNIRDFKVDKIKERFGIITLTPAQLLQYLRSL